MPDRGFGIMKRQRKDKDKDKDKRSNEQKSESSVWGQRTCLIEALVQMTNDRWFGIETKTKTSRKVKVLSGDTVAW